MTSEHELMTGRGQALYTRAKNLIPGGTQLLSKRPEMFAPELWPSYYEKAQGCKVWDLDGNCYTDMSIMGVGAAILGYADPDVDEAVIIAIRKGVTSTLNCPEEVELAQTLIELHPWAGMVRYARSGGEAMSLAVRIARAHTQRDTVMFSGYHGWNDWYLAANLGDEKGLDGQLMPGLAPNGVPRGLQWTAIPFLINDIASLRHKIKGKEKQIAAIVIEPARGENAPSDYLIALKELADEIGAVLIFDEITSGFRLCAGGLHRLYNVNPHLAVFAKSLANGYAMSAVIGTEHVMQAAQTTFISSTNWTDRVGPVAALATIQKYCQHNVQEHIKALGSSMKKMWQNTALKHDLTIKVSGLESLPSFSFDHDHAIALNTGLTVEMLKRGFLGFRQFRPSYAHSDSDMSNYENALDHVFAELKMMIEQKKPFPEHLHHTGFHRLTKE
jgi:glutamate-1-semialdehyde 2,1-aminomutase